MDQTHFISLAQAPHFPSRWAYSEWQPVIVSKLPFIESGTLDVALKSLVLDDELHLLEEGGGHGRRLLPQQDVDGLRHGVAELALLADRALAAFRVFAIRQTICNKNKQVLNYWGVVKRSACLPYTPTIQVLILLKSSVFSVNSFIYRK